MKKTIVLVLVLAVIMTVFTSCPKSSGGVQVDVFWYSFADTFLVSVRNAMIEEAKNMPEIRVTHHDGNANQTTQTQMVQTAVNRGSKLLVVNIVTTGSDESAMNIIELAKASNLPVIFFNREVSNDVINSYENAAFVGTDADEAGFMQGQAIAEFLLREENWDGAKSKFDLNSDNKISYVMFRGEHGNAEARGRTKYSVQEANRLLGDRLQLAPSPANQVSTQYEDDGISNYFLYGNWSAAEAANLMRTALSAHSLTNGSVELVIANNDDQALGAIEAMNEQGFNTGALNAGYIPVFGVDATAVAQEAIQSGKMTGTVLQDAVGMAATVFALTKNIVDGEPLLANTDDFNIDEGVNKIRVPYAIVTK